MDIKIPDISGYKAILRLHKQRYLCNGKTGKIIDIVEDRRLDNLIKYFGRYSNRASSSVKYIVIDMYSPYVSLINKMFPNAKIVIINLKDIGS